MQSIIKTPNLGMVRISQQVIKYFSSISDGDMEEALVTAKKILKSADIERLEVPKLISSSMTANGDDPDVLEFWVHKDSSTMFLIKPEDNYKKVNMVTKQDMTVIYFEKS